MNKNGAEIHPLVNQLHFARQELIRCLEGVSHEDALRRLGPMNSISWIVGHLANQESTYWLLLAQQKTPYPELHKLVGTGKPASTPPMDEMWSVWHEITSAADEYLEELTPDLMTGHFEWKGKPRPETIGTLLLRNIYHYWYHIGEASAIRQMLGHQNLPEFIGDMSNAPYQRE